MKLNKHYLGLSSVKTYKVLAYVLKFPHNSIYWDKGETIDVMHDKGYVIRPTNKKNGYDSYNFRLTMQGLWILFLLRKKLKDRTNILNIDLEKTYWRK